MNQSMSTAMSGLINFQSSLDVESNNIANTATVGYKSDKVTFTDVMYSSESLMIDDYMGYGTSIDTIKKDFSQGDITNTNNPYDFAIMGDGFFTIESKYTPTEIAYTRAGNFKRDQDGFLTTAVGDYVLGNTPTITTVPAQTIVDNRLYTNFIATAKGKTPTTIYTINAYSSDYKQDAMKHGNLGVSGNALKTPTSIIKDIEALINKYQYTLDQNQEETVVGDPVSYKTYNVEFPQPIESGKTLEITIDGVKYQETVADDPEDSFNKLTDQISSVTGLKATANFQNATLSIESIIPAKDFTINGAKNDFDNARVTVVSEASGSGQTLISAFENQLRDIITSINGSFITSRSEVNIPKSGDSFTNKIQLDLSNPILGISNVSMGDLYQEDGKLYIKQLDASYLVGYIAPVSFINNSGLEPAGDNKYLANDNSGEAKFIDGTSTIKSELLEVSNTDLSKSLVNLMVYQKAYESNSKVVTTSDELLKTALALKNK